MRVIWVSSGYDVDAGRLINRRLQQQGSSLEVFEDGCAEVEEAQLSAWCDAVARVLLLDLAHFELARMVNELTMELSAKQLVLPEAVQRSRKLGGCAAIARRLKSFFSEFDSINLAGFIHFRMQDTLLLWERCVLSAAEELALKREYLELMGVLSAFVQLQPARVSEVRVILNPDGSCTLIDGVNARIDYGGSAGEGVVSALVNLAPERVTVYDLSGGRSAVLADILIRVFEDRIRVFR